MRPTINRRTMIQWATIAAATPLVSAGPLVGLAAVATPATSAQETVFQELFVYLLRDGKLATARRPVEVTGGRVGRAALLALLSGTTDQEEAAGLTTGIPLGTELLDVVLDRATSVATVDLNEQFLAPPRSDEQDAEGEALRYLGRMGQIIFTLTQFSTITGVRFTIDGEPLTDLPMLEAITVNPISEPFDLNRPMGRANLEPVTPFIFVERPAVGEVVSFPLRVAGTANTFEAAFVLQLRDRNGDTLIEEPVMATSGTGTRGTFDYTLDLPDATDTGGLTLVAFEYSPRDGSPLAGVEIPLEIENGG